MIMRINNTPRKAGIYSQLFTILGFKEDKRPCLFHIYSQQADTFEKAIQFFYDKWPNCIGLEIRYSEPYPEELAKCC